MGKGERLPAGKELARAYFDGLGAAYGREGAREVWDHFAAVIHGAEGRDLDRLVELYPETPESLLELLALVDGTYWREYQGEKFGVYFLGSDYEEYPYYLLSAVQMVETRDQFAGWGEYLIAREYGDIPVDERITDDMGKLCWLHFSDCMNNGGSSRLFLDFSPSAKGNRGQVVRYMHDPDRLTVIADSFDEYLRMLMKRDYDFINEDTVVE